MAELDRQTDRKLSMPFRGLFRHWLPRASLWAAAMGIGIAAAVFASAADWAQTQLAQWTTQRPWIILVLMPVGLVSIAGFTRCYCPAAAGSGIPQVLAALRNEAQSLRAQLLALPIAILKPLLTLAGLLCGASIGREGPTVQIGAAIAHWAGRHRSRGMQHALIMAGGAAGVAAAFNTPLAGMIFAFEELASSLEEKTTGTLLLMVIMAAVVAIAMLGDHPYLGTTNATLLGLAQWRAVLLCGVIGGVTGGVFSRLLFAGVGLARQVIARHGLRAVLVLAVALAVLGLISDGATYGSGYAQARLALVDPLQLSPWYPALKIAATGMSYLSGIPGGIFSPSLAVGAGLGADLVRCSTLASPQAMVLLTMAAYFSGVTRAPLTGAVIVAEMSVQQAMILPLMAAALLAAAISRLVWRPSLYRALMAEALKAVSVH